MQLADIQMLHNPAIPFGGTVPIRHAITSDRKLLPRWDYRVCVRSYAETGARSGAQRKLQSGRNAKAIYNTTEVGERDTERIKLAKLAQAQPQICATTRVYNYNNSTVYIATHVAKETYLHSAWPVEPQLKVVRITEY